MDPDRGPPVVAPFPRETDYWPQDRQWMISFRVAQLDELPACLRKAEIPVRTDLSWEAAGLDRFARIYDPERKVMKLWGSRPAWAAPSQQARLSFRSLSSDARKDLASSPSPGDGQRTRFSRPTLSASHEYNDDIDRCPGGEVVQTTTVRAAAVLAATMILCAGSSANAMGLPTPAEEIATLEGRYSQTFVTGDVRTAALILADTFVGFGSDGKVTDRAAMLREVRSEPHQISAKITSLTVRLHGDTAIALGTEDDGSAGTQVVAHRMWLDTWRRTPAGWMMVASAEIARRR